MTTPRSVSLLGSTGSIGTQAIQIVLANPDRFRVTALSAGGGNLALLAEQAVRLQVDTVAVANGTRDEVAAALGAAAASAGHLAYRPEVVVGPTASADVASRPVDVVLNGITGSIGLAPTLAALEAGNVLALANKESLIVGGSLVMAAAKPGRLVPVDSEHSAI
ncbi:MAG: 1-deoxy-D-xylulose-5-phosphate reductoisomerase, partial [Actinomycetota bacterium]|nr:1-deoxy-D-xylulose-5-phosphate reductoisomerase [Actinomycetota bacterium]